jgi:hypothetical protein
MTGDFGRLFADLERRAGAYGVRVVLRPLPPETPAEFDGPSVALDPGYDLQSRCYYLAHALGSTAQWSTDTKATRAVFDEMHAAEESRAADPKRFERAVAAHLAFEERSSGHAVWLLADVGHAWAVPGYTTFFRADLAAVEEYHRSGVAPVWREFYPAWKEKAARGEVKIHPFEPRPVPEFRAITIPKQEVLREEDGQA